MVSLFRKIFPTQNDKSLKLLRPYLVQINEKEKDFESLTNEQLQENTTLYKQRIQNGESLDDLLVEAFANCREGSKRVLGQRHYDVQILGGITLHKGMIAEMRTGEGKTLSSTLAAYLNSLSGKSVHVITVNDYLAERDSQWMGQIYEFLGLKVSCILDSTPPNRRKEAYQADIVYGTNSEFGFDYLRDNLKFEPNTIVQTERSFAIIDEVDSILIDESRTPLIISAPSDDNKDMYLTMNKYISQLIEADFHKDEKNKTVSLTDAGIDHIEQLLRASNILTDSEGIYDIKNISLLHHITQALRAYTMFQKDVDYLVKDSQVMLIDEFTGRIMDGRRYSNGLHQALEAKEGLHIKDENQTIASITYQNYFRTYGKLSGMTGTALTEAKEFQSIYGLPVISIPTNQIVIREDLADTIFLTAQDKYKAIIEEVQTIHKKKQPILIGTVSIQQSEHIAELLDKEKIKHNILNAKHHEQEAQIIAQAGRLGSITIATNMAGRGTDIMLGGNAQYLIKELENHHKQNKLHRSESQIHKRILEIEEEIEAEKKLVIEAGGLYVIGTERHESRRIDNQLRGRSGRQGDPGISRFFLSLEDDLMRIFGSEKIQSLLSKLGMKDENISDPMINRAIEKAQQKVEAMNFDIRKNLLKFDDVMNEQRKIIFTERSQILHKDNIEEDILSCIKEVNNSLITNHIPEKSYVEQWDIKGLVITLQDIYQSHFDIKKHIEDNELNSEDLVEYLNDQSLILYKKIFYFDSHDIAEIHSYIYLNALDEEWREYLAAIDNLKQGIYLRAYGNKDPLSEYKHDSYELFFQMLSKLQIRITTSIFHFKPQETNKHNELLSLLEKEKNIIDKKIILSTDDRHEHRHTNIYQTRKSPEERDPNDIESWGKVGRNEPCPCGSTKKYKNCHGLLKH